MKKCKHCGTENPDSSFYCVKCGNKMNREQEIDDNSRGLAVLFLIIGIIVSIGLIVVAVSFEGWWSKLLLAGVAFIWYGIITGNSLFTGKKL